MPNPMWTWCALPGPTRSTKLLVDINSYGDGYTHRSTRGINPARPSWRLDFPIKSLADANAMDEFLVNNAAGGFWFEPPDMGSAAVFVTCDEWSCQVIDRTGQRSAAEIVGTFSATFERSFNPQPISPTVLALGRQNVVSPPLTPAAMARFTSGAPLPDAPTAPPVDFDGTMLPSPTTPFKPISQQPPAEPTDA